MPVSIYFRSADPNALSLSGMVFTMWSVLAGVVILTTNKYKKVTVDGDSLRVSNYTSEISIPLSEIVDVTERRLRGHPVTIHLKTSTKFGQAISFLAKSRSIAGELRQMAEKTGQ